jgi:hypothetical protein
MGEPISRQKLTASLGQITTELSFFAGSALDEIERLRSELEKIHASMFIEPFSSCNCKWCEAKRKNWAVEWPPEPPRIQALIDAHQEEVGRLRGGAYINPENCTNCGRAVVWDDPDKEMPVRMCPRCVYQRMTKAERESEQHQKVADACTRRYGEMEREIKKLRHDVNQALKVKIAGDAERKDENAKLRKMVEAAKESHLWMLEDEVCNCGPPDRRCVLREALCELDEEKP